MKDWHAPRASGSSKPVTVVIAVVITIVLLLSCLNGGKVPRDLSRVYASRLPSSNVQGLQGVDECILDLSLAQRTQTLRCFYQQAKRRVALVKPSSQSRTVQEAAERYTRQTGRDPPPGFEGWFSFAKEHGSIIDGYDQVTANLAPFRQIGRAAMREAITRLINIPNRRNLRVLSIKSGKLVGEADDKVDRNDAMHTFIDPIAPFLPDMTFVINLDDQEKLKGPIFDPPKKPVDQGVDIEHSLDGWQFITAPCPQSFVSRASFVARPSLDICQHVNSSAFTNSRADLRHQSVGIANVVPIFSWSKFSTSRDVLVPHWAYTKQKFRGWDHPADTIPFDAKEPTLFWRGSTTGSTMRFDHWRANHRVRLVQYLNDLRAALDRLKAFTLQSAERWASIDAGSLVQGDSLENRAMLARLATLENLVDANFTAALQCGEDKRGCGILKDELAIVPGVASQDEFKMRFVYDIDGNSMSGRFYRQLESNSLVFKQTVLSEWHDERILPWYHYIPIDSHGLDAIPHLLDYFVNDAEGQDLAREIAANGRTGAERDLRIIDLSVYWYRVLLEYSALF